MSRHITTLDMLKQQAWARRMGLAAVKRPSAVERLEPRRLLAAFIDDRELNVIGTDGPDVISLTRSGDNVVANVNGDTDTFDMGDYQFVFIDGAGANDTITNGNGTGPDGAIEGGSGNDRLVDGNGGYTLSGGSGHDTLVPGTGNDLLTGASGTDTVDYSARTTAFTFDLVTVQQNPDAKATTTGDETDTFVLIQPDPDGDPTPDVEVFVGTQLADTFTIAADTEDAPPVHFVLDGRGGNDTFSSFANGDTTLSYTGLGGDGNDVFNIGPIMLATVIGGAGNDQFLADEDSGPASADGGAGTDFISFTSVGAPDVVDLNDYTSVENASVFDGRLIGTPANNRLEVRDTGTIQGGAGNDTLIGSDADFAPVSLLGEGGNDLLVGSDGEDTLDGGPGTDTLLGGDGNDTLLNGEQFRAGIFDSVLYGEATAGNDVITLTRSGIDNVVLTVNGLANTFDMDDFSTVRLFGFDGDDQITAGEGINVVSFRGGDGNDRLVDGNGHNFLHGEGGDDTLVSGLGSDFMSGGGGRNTADYSARTANLVLSDNGDDDDGQAGENDRIVEVERFLGGSGNDRFTGGAGNNTFFGSGGSDTANGNGGADALHGEGGDDLLIGGTGDDFLDGGSGADFLSGRQGNDTLLGQSGNDTLFANDGFADTVNGGSDSDTATVDGGGVDAVSNVETFA